MKINKVKPKKPNHHSNWYVGKRTKSFGQYFGSLSSLSNGETYLTHVRRFIVNRLNDEVSVSVNSCSHFGAQLLTDPGVQDVETIICPVHRWSFEPCGALKNAPYLDKCDGMNLDRPDYGIWNGYILGFPQKEIYSSSLINFGQVIGCGHCCFDPREFIFLEESSYVLPYPRPLMSINYFDGYHVPLIHQSTFSAVADCSNYEWEFSDLNTNSRLAYSIQAVRARKDVEEHLKKLISSSGKDTNEFGWADLHVWIKKNLAGIDTPIDKGIFALWAAIYGEGHTMLELYEGGLLLAVSYLVNIDQDNPETGNKNLVEYYIHRSVPEKHRKMMARKFIHAYEQSAREDDESCLALWEGHRLVGSNSLSCRWIHPNLEKGVEHFHEWFMKKFVA